MDLPLGAKLFPLVATALLLQGTPPWMAEFERRAEETVWPGFDAREVPLATFDGERTWLLRHPSPPEGFEPVPGVPGLAARDGRHQAIRANSSAQLGGVLVATADFSGDERSSAECAGVMIHEAFHVFQRENHPDWAGDEGALISYPVDDVEILALRRLETKALQNAFRAKDTEGITAWATKALSVRAERFAKLPGTASAYERATELNEGLAQFVQGASAPPERPPHTALENFPADAVRARCYRTGEAFALLLEVLDPAWKEQLTAGEAGSLDELLAATLSHCALEDKGVEFTDEERRDALETARRDVATATRERSRMHEEFLNRDGWTVVVEASPNRPLSLHGFDPMNVKRLSSAKVLHTRWLKFGDEAEVFEILDGQCVTEAAGDHPLLSGVCRVVATGLAEKPRFAKLANGMAISCPGFRAKLVNAKLSWGEDSLTIRLGSP